MEENENKIEKKMKIFLDDEISSSSYQSEQIKEKLNLRKKKIFNILFSKKRDIFKIDNKDTINDSRRIDINSLNCDEEIKKDPIKYIKTKFEIKNWFKFFFSSNKNEIYLSLFLINKYIELQILEIKDETKRKLSRNDTELIQRLCDNLLSDDIKIIYDSCACLTNLGLFPKNIEKRIYSERNLEKILKFFDVLSKNIAILGHEPLLLFSNICVNEEVQLYLVKNSFSKHLYKFIENLLNDNNNALNEELKINIIKNVVFILFRLIELCKIDDNYFNNFVIFIPFLKIITSNYYNNIDNSFFDENSAFNLITLWKFFSKGRRKSELYISEIIKDGFLHVLINLYYKIKDKKNKNEILDIFINLSSIGDEFDKILINEGILPFYFKEIQRYEFSDIQILNNIIFSCTNLAMGEMGQKEKLLESGIIFKIIDITCFYINDNLDDEIIILLINSLKLISTVVIHLDKQKQNLLSYKNCIIITIFCNFLKIDIDPSNKHKLFQRIIYAIHELNVASEELEPKLQEEYNFLLIKNSLDNLLDNYNGRKYIDQNCKYIIEDIKEFIKDKENK